jgi:anti-sigma factor RsiW
VRHTDAADLFAYVRGELDPTSAREVETHAEQCSTCREHLQTASWMRSAAQRRGAALFAPHPTAPELVEFVEAREHLTEHRIAEIEEHLELCATCGEDVGLLQEVAASGSRTPEQPAWIHKLFSIRLWTVPAWAYAVMVVLAIPAAVGVTSLTSRHPVAIQLLPQQVRLQLQDTRGAEGSVTEVHRSRPLLLSVEVPILTDGTARYDGVLTDAMGKRVWEQPSLQSANGLGEFLVYLPPDRLPPGLYTLSIVEVVGGKPGQRFDFPFQVAD